MTSCSGSSPARLKSISSATSEKSIQIAVVLAVDVLTRELARVGYCAIRSRSAIESLPLLIRHGWLLESLIRTVELGQGDMDFPAVYEAFRPVPSSS